jgi:hypothetical protein
LFDWFRCSLAYYSLLTPTITPTVAELVSAWEVHKSSLSSLSTRYNRSVLFAEVGYCSAPGTTLDPAHAGCGGSHVSLDAQTNAYEAMFEALYNEAWFKGVFMWAVLTDPTDGGPNNSDFSPIHKPAFDILKKWWAPSSTSSSPTWDHRTGNCTSTPASSQLASTKPCYTRCSQAVSSNPSQLHSTNAGDVEAVTLNQCCSSLCCDKR